MHIGHLVKKVFDEKGMSVTDFARRIHCARPNVYSIFERYDIGVEQLLDISEALNHNFLDDIQLNSGLSSSLQTKQLNINISLETLSRENAKRIAQLIEDIAEEINS